MPLFAYECDTCHTEFEQFLKLSEYKASVPCPTCGRAGRKVLTCQIQRDEPTWLDDSVRGCLQDTEAEKPIETRTDYKRYLKDNGITERA